MPRNHITFSLITLLCLSFFVAAPQNSRANNNEDLTAEKLITAHLKSLGNPAYLKKVRSRMFLGNTNVDFILGNTGNLKGNSMFITQGTKLGIVLRYLDTNYPGEYFAFDGKDVTVATISPGRKSPIGDFLFRFDKVIKGGFLGGTLTSSWPLLDNKDIDADLKCREVKKEGRRLYELEYHPRKGFGDMKICMYFDPKTFQHVRTEYSVQNRNDSSVDHNFMEAETANFGAIGQARFDSYYTLVEKFEDYRKVGGMTLPYRYILDYSQSGGAGSFIARWTVNVGKWVFNAPNIDPKVFQAEK